MTEFEEGVPRLVMKDALTFFYEYELRLWERVAHENVIKIFEIYDDGTRGDYDGHPCIYLLMEYADLGTLMSWRDHGRLERNPRVY